MSLLVTWIANENAGQTSAYIVSDSRISRNQTFIDIGRKLFASRKYPDVFGYVGDALLPQIILSQVIDIIDAGLLSSNDSEKRIDLVHKQIIDSIVASKKLLCKTSNIQIIHLTRLCKENKNPFRVYLLNYDNSKELKWQIIKSDFSSIFVKAFGSGKKDFYVNMSKRDYSRDIFHAFIKTVEVSNGKSFGGPPQLVGLYKSKNDGISFGIIYNKERYYLGQIIKSKINLNKIEWRNENFEICCGLTKKIKPHATLQPRF